MKYTSEHLRKLITDAECFRMSLRNRTDDSAHYWRCHIAERIYELRQELQRLPATGQIAPA